MPSTVGGDASIESAAPVITASSLTVSRGGHEVLHDLDFVVAAGRITGLLGPSGCGKTTLMRCVAGAQHFDGSLTVLGHSAGDPVLRHAIGYAAQSAAVYADLTVIENLRYFARVLGAAAGDVARVIEQVDLGSYGTRLVGRLSGGQRSRVSLAVALLGAPKVLILDEPTVGLDPVLRAQLWQIFRELAGSGISLLVSSHVMDEAGRCDELLLMRDGDLLAQLAPDALRAETGRDDLEQAFLVLIERAAGRAA